MGDTAFRTFGGGGTGDLATDLSTEGPRGSESPNAEQTQRREAINAKIAAEVSAEIEVEELRGKLATVEAEREEWRDQAERYRAELRNRADDVTDERLGSRGDEDDDPEGLGESVEVAERAGRTLVSASEYDALAEMFRAFVAECEMVDPDEVDASALGDHLIPAGYSDEDIRFGARAIAQGSRALSCITQQEAKGDKELREKVELLIPALLDLLPVHGEWGRGYRVDSLIEPKVVALADEWVTAAQHFCEVQALLRYADPRAPLTPTEDEEDERRQMAEEDRLLDVAEEISREQGIDWDRSRGLCLELARKRIVAEDEAYRDRDADEMAEAWEGR